MQGNDPAMYEGDIQLSLPQAQRIYAQFKSQNDPTAIKSISRQAIVGKEWGKVIPYVIEDGKFKQINFQK